MKTLILAGGLGTRLQSIMPDRPKPMAEAAGRPFLAYLIEQLRDQNFREIVLCLGYLGEQIQNYFSDGSPWGVHIDYAIEDELLGTAGAVRNAQGFINEDFLVMNGDSYLEIDLNSLVQGHRTNRTAFPLTIGTLATTRIDKADAYGAVEMNPDGRIKRFSEKGQTGSRWINAGIYVLEQEILEFIPAGRPVSIEKETFPQLLANGRHLRTYPAEGFFVDIGTPVGYLSFQHYLLEKKS